MLDTSKLTREECYAASQTLVDIWNNCSYLDFADLCDILTAQCVLMLNEDEYNELTTKEEANIKSAAQLLQCASFCFAQAEKEASGIVASNHSSLLKCLSEHMK